MPAMIVWPVSSSVWTRKVGSSSERAPRALDILSWSALVLGSTATWMTGSGKSSFSRMIGWAGSHSVSPVRVFFSPMPATMSPVLDRVAVLAVVGVHLQEPPDPLLVARRGVERPARPC